MSEEEALGQGAGVERVSISPTSAHRLGKIIRNIALVIVALSVLAAIGVLYGGPTQDEIDVGSSYAQEYMYGSSASDVYETVPDWGVRVTYAFAIILAVAPLAGIVAGVGTIVQLLSAQLDRERSE